MTQTCSIAPKAAEVAELRHLHHRYPQMAALGIQTWRPIHRNRCLAGSLSRWKPLNRKVALSWGRERGTRNRVEDAFRVRGGK